MTTTPLYEQVKENILKRIILGEWPEGFVLPTEMELAETLGVSYGTVRRAMAELVRQSVIMRRQRVGTVVTGRSTLNTLDMFYHFFRLHRIDGTVVNSEVEPVSTEVRAMTDEEQKLFQPVSDDRVVQINRVRTTEDGPTMLDHFVLPAVYAKPLAAGQQEAPTLIYKWLLEVSGLRLSAVREELGAKIATPEQAKALRITSPPPHALLEMRQVAYDHRNRPIAVSRHFARTEKHRYVNEVR